MNDKIKHIIYDWDGTLCDSIPEAFRATCSVFSRCKLDLPTFSDFIDNLGPPFINFYRERGVPESVCDGQIWAWYHESANHHENELFPDVCEVLTEQRRDGFTIVLVTSQQLKTINLLLDRHGCRDLFDLVLCEATPTKSSFFKRACEFMEEAPERVYCVGDFGSDMRQAKAAGLFPVGIVRRREDRAIAEVLYNAGARRVITRLRDLVIK